MSPIQQSTPVSTRDSILDAAGVLLGRHGYYKTTMEELANEAGVARRTLYLHFESKDDIFLARIDRVVERLLVELEKIAAEAKPALDRVRRMLRLRVLFRLDTVSSYQHSLDAIFQELRKPYLEHRERYIRLESAVFERVLEDGRKKGDVSVADAAGAARALVNATNALIPSSLSVRELGSRKTIEAELETLVDLLTLGIQKRRA